MIKNRKLDHIGMAVTDPAAGAGWYQEVLGFHLQGQFPDTQGKPVYFVANADETVVYEIYGGDHLPDAAIGKIDHIAYPSDDIERDFQFCMAQGYEICSDGIEAIPTFWERGIRYFILKTATGEKVEFCQKL